MRILHIVEVLHVDGRTTLLRDLVTSRGLAAQHAVLSLKFPGPLAEEFSRLGVPVLALNLNQPFQNVTEKIAVAFRARQFQPDVCLCWSGGANLVSVMPWLRHTPVVWTIHNSIEKWNSRGTRLGMALLARLSRLVPYRVVCCSQATHRIYQDIHRFDANRLITIANGVDTSRFTPDAEARNSVRKTLAIRADEFVVATSARMSDPAYRNQGDFKDLETLFTAIRMACDVRSDLRFIMFGTNIDEANGELVGLLRRMRLEGVVTLLGFRKDVPALLASADLYAMSSVSGEGLPLALIEAMACGLIPVCTDSGGIRDAVAQMGIIVPQKNCSALAEAILHFADMETKERRRRSEDVVQHVRRNFSIEHVAAQYRAVICEATGQEGW